MCRSTSAYCQVTRWTQVSRPVTLKTQPIRLSGTRRATIAPTDAKVSASSKNAPPPMPAKMSSGCVARMSLGPTASSAAVGTARTTQTSHISAAVRRTVTRARMRRVSQRGPPPPTALALAGESVLALIEAHRDTPAGRSPRISAATPAGNGAR